MSSFRSKKGERYATAYMMDEQLAGDPRKQRIDRIEQAIVRELIAEVPANGLIVDIPSGNGRMTALVDRDDVDVVAMDYNHSMLAAMDGRGVNCSRVLRVQADVTALPLPDKCVDLLVNFRLMHHIEDEAMQVRMYREIVRVTRGRIVTTFWSTHCWRHVRKKMMGKKIRGFPVSPEHFRSVCRQAGLAVDRIVSTRPWYEEECVAVCSLAPEPVAAC